MGRAILSLDLILVSDALQIPEGYELTSVHYDPNTRKCNFLVESSELDKTEDTGPLPQIHLMVQVEQTVQGQKTYHKYTTWIQKGIH